MRQILLIMLSLVLVSHARAKDSEQDSVKVAGPEVVAGRYIVEFTDAPILAFGGQRGADGDWVMAPTRTKSGQFSGQFDPATSAVETYRNYLDESADASLMKASALLATPLKPRYRYRYLTNGVSLNISPEQAGRLATMDGVKRVYPVTVQRPHTDAGPAWIGAPGAWGASGSMGEGVVVGIVDSGVNWDHPAFADIGGDNFNHSNPRGRQYGLCGNAQVRCNDKLIGVYDFTEEGARIGRDEDGHGTHVASTAIGNIRRSNVVGITASIERDVAGVAPHANVITYKVCRADDPATEDDENVCFLDAILSAFDQIVVDQVDVVNYSIGGDSSNPWSDPDALSMLTARAAGTLIVTSAGNDGSAANTISSPANAPWLVTVANTTHNRRFENTLDSLIGGNLAAPQDLNGVGFTGGFGPAKIVHAADFGNALCGTGDAELQSSCGAHTGSSNPFAAGTFDGEIVVCDRGTYGRIEKGFNVRAAGAGGFVLANTSAQGESIVSDDHCLPGTHLGAADGDELRTWLAGRGDDLSARINGQSVVIDDLLGDRVSASSSRGPDSFAPNVIKPDLAAPGSNILAAGLTGSTSSFKSGTSMASPHVAGSAALVLSLRPELTPGEVHSLLVTTAFNDQMIDSDGSSLADAYDVGAGRVNPEAALRGGLVLDVNRAAFLGANPVLGGSPGTLNLPSIASSRCIESCTFLRQVKALDGGQWTTSVVSADGVTGQVDPGSFSLEAGEFFTLNITLDVSDPALIGQSVSGYVVLTPSDPSVATQRLVFQVIADAGDLPTVLSIETSNNQGSEMFDLSGIAALPQAGFDTLALTRARITQRPLAQDSTNDDPYNNVTGVGAYFITTNVGNVGSMLYASTEADASGTDLDLFVGRDLDGDLQPDLNEELCRSTSSGPREVCVIDSAQSGQHWVLVQNWRASSAGAADATTLTTAVVSPAAGSSLVATGPGNIPALVPFSVRLGWDQGQMATGERWIGGLSLRTGDQSPSLGVIPVVLSRLSDNSLGTAVNPDMNTLTPRLLLDGETQPLTLAPDQGHARLFMDVPASSSRVTLDISAGPQVQWQLVAQAVEFEPPLVPPAAAAARVVSSGQGSARVSAELSGERIYVVPLNTDAQSQTLSVNISLTRSGPSALQSDSTTANVPVPGLWFNPARDGTGFNLNQLDGQLIVEWYTYLEDGTPVWYLAQAPFAEGDDFWQASLNQFRWDGSRAASTSVGTMALVFSTPTQATLNFRLHGVSGSEPYQVIIDDLSCASNGAEVARTGLWFVPALPGFGYSILNVGGDQVQVNYLYGPTGLPRWVLGQGSAQDSQISLSQFSGYCPSCATSPGGSVEVGSNTLIYDSAEAGSVTTTLEFAQPLSGSWRTVGSLSNLTPQIRCN